MKKPVCRICKREGHYQFQCWRRPKKTKTRKYTSDSERKKLIKELDKYYSLYIRWLYANSSGYDVCYTCKKNVPVQECQCGHYISRRWFATRWNRDNLRPQCLTKGHRVGNKDISEITVGDIVPSLFGKTEIVGTRAFASPIVEIEAEGKRIKSSPEHKMLVEHNSKLEWMSAIQIYHELKKGSSLYIIEI